MNGVGIIVSREVKSILGTLKEHPRETYGDVVARLLHLDGSLGQKGILPEEEQEMSPPEIMP